MTRRAVLLGLLAALLMGAWGQYASKYIPGAWGLVRGHLPVSVFGAFVVFVIAVNPLLRRIRAGFELKPAEIAIIMALSLIGCAITDAGMSRYFPRQLITPIQQVQTRPGWRTTDVLSYTPPAMLANDGKYDKDVMEGFFAASGSEKETFPFTKVPWHAWWKPLTLWGVLIAAFMLGSVCLGVIVHKQWSDRERLRYPLAEIVSSLLRLDEKGRPAIFKEKIFWIGLAVPFAIRMFNFASYWIPNSIEIPLTFDFSELRNAFPELMKVPYASYFSTPTIYPAIVGLAFLLAADIGLSISLANPISVAVLYFMISYGVDLSGGDMQGGLRSWQIFGSYLAMACMIIYGGRRYYWQTLKAAAGFKPHPDTNTTAVKAMRIFFMLFAVAVIILAANGLPWTIALLAWMIMTLMVVVCARLNAECGTFSLEPGWHMPGILIGLFGMGALGPQAIIVLGMLMVLIQVEAIESVMPFVVNGLKFSADSGLARTGKTGLILAAGILLTIVVTIPTALWADYHHPAALRRGGDGTPIWNTASRVISDATNAGQPPPPVKVSNGAVWRNMHTNSRFIVGVTVGFVAMMAFSLLRLRFSWWPLHPVLIIVFSTWFAARFGFSFFIGWCIKMAVMKYGGGQKFTAIKPAMIGLIVGDLAGGFVMMAINGLYYAATGFCAPQYWRVLW